MTEQQMALPVDDEFFEDIAKTMLDAMAKRIGEIAGPSIIIRNRKVAIMLAAAAIKQTAKSLYEHGLKEGGA